MFVPDLAIAALQSCQTLIFSLPTDAESEEEEEEILYDITGKPVV